jgi:Carboxypeptidase regulatory-like domain
LYKGSNQWRTTTAVGFEVTPTTSHCPSPWHLAAMFCALLAFAHAQTASTGSLIGFVVDPAGSVVPGVILHLIEQASGELHLAVSDNEGRFSFPFLRPGSYQLQISKSQFAPLSISEIVISVTETRRVEVHLRLATVVEQTQVSSELPIVQTDNSTLGRTVDRRELTSLPLVTRNIAQIVGLSPGVNAGVFNAGELGLGGIALSQIASSNDGIFAHGARSYDNNWELDGISVSDVQSSGAGSGGIPIPNPDGLQEFKVQTALYDAAYGRYGGANVSVITKSGTNFYHGTVFEFLRNDVLNANDFFLNQVGRPRPNLKQNQFGFSFGGPIKKEKLLFFGSYQGTRQVNGAAAGQSRIACTSSLSSPPLTNDRSQIELGRLFGGMSGTMGGVAIAADGSNINPAALALLNFKLPDGSFLIPT